MDVFKVAAFAVSGVLLALLLRQTKPEYSVFISMAVCSCIFLYLLNRMQAVFGYLDQLRAQVPVDGIYLDTILKMLGITYIAEFSSSICKDAGYQTIAGQIEIFGKLAVLVLCLPILMALLDAVKGFLS